MTTHGSGIEGLGLGPALRPWTHGAGLLAFLLFFVYSTCPADAQEGSPNASPRVIRVEPTVIPAGSNEVRVRVDGEGFTGASRVVVDGVPVPTDVLGPDRLQAHLPAAMLAIAKDLNVRVGAGEPGIADSSPVALTVANPVPQLTVVEVPVLVVGEAASIRMYGKAFRPDSTIQVAGKRIETTYRSVEELSGTIPAEALTSAGVLAVNVATPGPGGGFSLAGQIVVTDPVFPGRFIAFASNRRHGRNHVYLLDRKGNRLDPLEEANSPNGTDAYPSISADGRFIAFQSDRHRGQSDIFLFDRQKRTLDPLLEANHPTAFDGFPAISADGRFIVFESDRLGKPKIFLFDLRARALSELSQANEATADDGLAAISN